MFIAIAIFVFFHVVLLFPHHVEKTIYDCKHSIPCTMDTHCPGTSVCHRLLSCPESFGICVIVHKKI